MISFMTWLLVYSTAECFLGPISLKGWSQSTVRDGAELVWLVMAGGGGGSGGGGVDPGTHSTLS